MKQEDIEEIIGQYPLMDVREIVLAVAVRVHDAALEEAANRAVEAIVEDFTDRRGLRQEWEQIDPGTQAEIVAEWRDIVRALKMKP